MRAPLTRELVVATARAELEANGVDSLSLRHLARTLGVTAPALYAHIADKQDLLAAVATDHFERLATRFAAIEEADPLARVRALSRAYVDHALESPTLFRLMFRYPPTPVAGVEAFPPATRAFESAASATAEAIAAGELAGPDPTLTSMTMWAAVHGVAEVLLLGFAADAEAAEALITSTIETVIAGQRVPR